MIDDEHELGGALQERVDELIEGAGGLGFVHDR
jgi:hypothetical protein